MNKQLNSQKVYKDLLQLQLPLAHEAASVIKNLSTYSRLCTRLYSEITKAKGIPNDNKESSLLLRAIESWLLEHSWFDWSEAGEYTALARFAVGENEDRPLSNYKRKRKSMAMNGNAFSDHKDFLLSDDDELTMEEERVYNLMLDESLEPEEKESLYNLLK